MNTLLVLAVVLLATLSVNAHGGGGGGGGKGGRGRGPPFPFPPLYPGIRGRGFCDCRGGRFNLCSGLTGTRDVGCPNTNQYRRCTNQVCAIETCTSGQVWDSTLNACAPCAAGMHVAANLQVCVCDQGTMFDFDNKTCVDCPKDSTQEADTCYCPQTKAFDSTENACKDCPLGSIFTRQLRCQCNASQFWNEGDWACQNCPGAWSPKQTRKPWFRPGSTCQCTGENQIFDRETVKCFPCPTGTTASRDNSYCGCPNQYQIFNKATSKCECKEGLVADSAGTGCVRPAITTKPTTVAGQISP